MRFSHAAHMAGQIQLELLRLINEDGFPVSVLANLAGCSESLVYQWTQGKTSPRGDYLKALEYRLASEYSNYRLLTLGMPPGLRLGRVQVEGGANGKVDDEVADGNIALANATVAHRGNDPDGIASARRELRDVEKRLEGEELQLRARQDGSTL